MSSRLEDRVRDRVNSIQDPCSLAQRMPIGLADMGLLMDVRLSGPVDAAGRRDVALVLRVTAPGCMYLPFMDRSIRAALEELDEVASVSTEWDPDADWSPREIAAPVRRRLQEIRAGRRRAGA